MITDMQDLFSSGYLGCGISSKRSLSWSIGKFSLFVSRMIVIIHYRVNAYLWSSGFLSFGIF